MTFLPNSGHHWAHAPRDPLKALLLEYCRVLWHIEYGDMDGIVNAHPFRRRISTAIEPACDRVFNHKTLILSLFVGSMANVLMPNRLDAFMTWAQN